MSIARASTAKLRSSSGNEQIGSRSPRAVEMAESGGRKASPETAGDREKRHESVKAA